MNDEMVKGLGTPIPGRRTASVHTSPIGAVQAILLAGLAAASGAPAHGFEARDLLGFKVGPVGIRPSMSLAEQFNDNILYTSGVLQTSDFITIISPGFTAVLGQEESGRVISFGYRFDAMLYADNDRYNGTDHNADLSVTLAGNRVRSTTSASAGFASSIYSGYDRVIEGIYVPAGKVDRMPYSFSTRLAYDVTAKTAAYVAASFNGLIFPETSLFYRDRNDWRVNLGGDYAIRPKLRLLTEVYYGQSSYGSSGVGATSSNWDRVGGNVGFRSELTERLNGTAKVGYEFWDRGTDTGDTFTTAISLGYRLADRTGLSLNFNRSARESVSAVGGAYVGYQGGLGIQHQLGTKRPITLGANANANLNEQDSGREDAYYTLGVSGTYAFREWLRFMLTYQFDSRDGDISLSRNYTVNTVTFSVGAGY